MSGTTPAIDSAARALGGAQGPRPSAVIKRAVLAYSDDSPRYPLPQGVPHARGSVRGRRAAGDLWQNTHGLAFTTKYGTPIEPGNLSRMFALRARRAGLRVIPVRNTRHACSSLLVALGVHPKVAQHILRHSGIAMDGTAADG